MHCAEKAEIRVIMAVIFLSTRGSNLEIVTYDHIILHNIFLNWKIVLLIIYVYKDL